MHETATKRCPKCRQAKPLSNFGKNRSRKDGLQNYCKSCRHRHYEANREKVIERVRLWNAANPGKSQERSRRWREAYPERVRAHARRWAKNNPAKKRAWTQGRRAKKRGLPHDLTESQWQFMLALFGRRCAYCGRLEIDVGPLERDHVIPPSADGGYTFGNIVPACGHDNKTKSNRCWHAWMQSKGYDIKAFRERMESINVVGAN